jgi:hypothetical protein
MSLAWSNARAADQREQYLKTERLRRKDAHWRRPLVRHSLDEASIDDSLSANDKWLDAQTAAWFVAFLVLAYQL